ALVVTYSPYGVTGSAPRRRRGGCLVTTILAVVALLIVAVAADFVAKGAAENEVATQIQQQGFPKKPAVSIEGFPFLTQVLSRDIGQVRLSAADIPEGPLRISTVTAVANGIHLNGDYSSGTIDQISGTVLIHFSALAAALESELGPAGQAVGSAGLTLTAAGPGEVKASLDLVLASGSATWRVTRLSGQQLNVRLVASSGVPSSFLRPLSNVTFAIPRLPFGMTIQNVSVVPDGIAGVFSATHVPFKQ
ncbi:MAG: LmeA family phospholipid-binding protein, partial [Streptosporangiaceae bacterium]